MIAAETGVVNTVDPLAGSYAIEAMTDTIEHEAEALIERIDRSGGTLTAIETGFIQREIQEAAYRAQQAIDSGESIVVGVNRFVGEARGAPIDVFKVDAEVERGQIARLRALRQSRGEAWQAAVTAVTEAARSGANLVPPIITAVEAQATVGEIADAMRLVFGEFTESAGVL